MKAYIFSKPLRLWRFFKSHWGCYKDFYKPLRLLCTAPLPPYRARVGQGWGFDLIGCQILLPLGMEVNQIPIRTTRLNLRAYAVESNAPPFGKLLQFNRPIFTPPWPGRGEVGQYIDRCISYVEEINVVMCTRLHTFIHVYVSSYFLSSANVRCSVLYKTKVYIWLDLSL